MSAPHLPILPRVATAADTIFGGSNTVRDYMVPMAQIPAEFHGLSGKWADIVSRWFFRGLPGGTEFVPVPGIDRAAALRHLAVILRSFEPKHEHKEACVAYLLSLWFSDVKIPSEKRAEVSP